MKKHLAYRCEMLCDSASSVAKAAAAPYSFFQRVNRLETGVADRSQDKLGDSVSPVQREGLSTKMYQADFDFTSIIGINSAGCIDKRDAMFDSQARSGPDLQLKALRQSNRKTGRRKMDVTGLKNNFFCERSSNIHARRLSSRVLRQGQVTLRRRQEPAKLNCNSLHHMPRPNFLTISA
jgi:hypothetical protein